MSFVNKRTRVFEENNSLQVTHVRSEGRMKSYPSTTDLRAWCDIVEDRRQHILNYQSRVKTGLNPEKIIPVEFLVEAIVSFKNEKMKQLEQRIDYLEKMLDVYDKLDLTDEQQNKLVKLRKELKKAIADLAVLHDDICECTACWEISEAKKKELEDAYKRWVKVSEKQVKETKKHKKKVSCECLACHERPGARDKRGAERGRSKKKKGKGKKSDDEGRQTTESSLDIDGKKRDHKKGEGKIGAAGDKKSTQAGTGEVAIGTEKQKEEDQAEKDKLRKEMFGDRELTPAEQKQLDDKLKADREEKDKLKKEMFGDRELTPAEQKQLDDKLKADQAEKDKLKKEMFGDRELTPAEQEQLNEKLKAKLAEKDKLKQEKPLTPAEQELLDDKIKADQAERDKLRKEMFGDKPLTSAEQLMLDDKMKADQAEMDKLRKEMFGDKVLTLEEQKMLNDRYRAQREGTKIKTLKETQTDSMREQAVRDALKKELFGDRELTPEEEKILESKVKKEIIKQRLYGDKELTPEEEKLLEKKFEDEKIERDRLKLEMFGNRPLTPEEEKQLEEALRAEKAQKDLLKRRLYGDKELTPEEEKVLEEELKARQVERDRLKREMFGDRPLTLEEEKMLSAKIKENSEKEFLKKQLFGDKKLTPEEEQLLEERFNADKARREMLKKKLFGDRELTEDEAKVLEDMLKMSQSGEPEISTEKMLEQMEREALKKKLFGDRELTPEEEKLLEEKLKEQHQMEKLKKRLFGEKRLTPEEQRLLEEKFKADQAEREDLKKRLFGDKVLSPEEEKILDEKLKEQHDKYLLKMQLFGDRQLSPSEERLLDEKFEEQKMQKDTLKKLLFGDRELSPEEEEILEAKLREQAERDRLKKEMFGDRELTPDEEKMLEAKLKEVLEREALKKRLFGEKKLTQQEEKILEDKLKAERLERDLLKKMLFGDRELTPEEEKILEDKLKQERLEKDLLKKRLFGDRELTPEEEKLLEEKFKETSRKMVCKAPCSKNTQFPEVKSEKICKATCAPSSLSKLPIKKPTVRAAKKPIKLSDVGIQCIAPCNRRRRSHTEEKSTEMSTPMKDSEVITDGETKTPLKMQKQSEMGVQSTTICSTIPLPYKLPCVEEKATEKITTLRDSSVLTEKEANKPLKLQETGVQCKAVCAPKAIENVPLVKDSYVTAKRIPDTQQTFSELGVQQQVPCASKSTVSSVSSLKDDIVKESREKGIQCKAVCAPKELPSKRPQSSGQQDLIESTSPSSALEFHKRKRSSLKKDSVDKGTQCKAARYLKTRSNKLPYLVEDNNIIKMSAKQPNKEQKRSIKLETPSNVDISQESCTDISERRKKVSRDQKNSKFSSTKKKVCKLECVDRTFEDAAGQVSLVDEKSPFKSDKTVKEAPNSPTANTKPNSNEKNAGEELSPLPDGTFIDNELVPRSTKILLDEIKETPAVRQSKIKNLFSGDVCNAKCAQQLEPNPISAIDKVSKTGKPYIANELVPRSANIFENDIQPGQADENIVSSIKPCTAPCRTSSFQQTPPDQKKITKPFGQQIQFEKKSFTQQAQVGKILSISSYTNPTQLPQESKEVDTEEVFDDAIDEIVPSASKDQDADEYLDSIALQETDKQIDEKQSLTQQVQPEIGDAGSKSSVQQPSAGDGSSPHQIEPTVTGSGPEPTSSDKENDEYVESIRSKQASGGQLTSKEKIVLMLSDRQKDEEVAAEKEDGLPNESCLCDPCKKRPSKDTVQNGDPNINKPKPILQLNEEGDTALKDVLFPEVESDAKRAEETKLPRDEDEANYSEKTDMPPEYVCGAICAELPLPQLPPLPPTAKLPFDKECEAPCAVLFPTLPCTEEQISIRSSQAVTASKKITSQTSLTKARVESAQSESKISGERAVFTTQEVVTQTTEKLETFPSDTCEIECKGSCVTKMKQELSEKVIPPTISYHKYEDIEKQSIQSKPVPSSDLEHISEGDEEGDITEKAISIKTSEEIVTEEISAPTMHIEEGEKEIPDTTSAAVMPPGESLGGIPDTASAAVTAAGVSLGGIPDTTSAAVMPPGESLGGVPETVSAAVTAAGVSLAGIPDTTSAAVMPPGESFGEVPNEASAAVMPPEESFGEVPDKTSSAVMPAIVSPTGMPDTTSAAIMPPGESLEGVPDKVSAAVMPASVSPAGMPGTTSAAVMPPEESLEGVPDKVSAAVMPAGVSPAGMPDTTSAAVMPPGESIGEIPDKASSECKCKCRVIPSTISYHKYEDIEKQSVPIPSSDLEHTSAAVMPPGESLEGIPDTASAAVMPAGVSLKGMPDTTSAAVMPPGESLGGVPDTVSAAVTTAGVSLGGIPDTTSAAVMPPGESLGGVPDTVSAAVTTAGVSLGGIPDTTSAAVMPPGESLGGVPDTVSAAVTTAGVSLGGIPDTTSAAVMPPGESLGGVPDTVSAAVTTAGVSLGGIPDTTSAAVMPPGESLGGVPDTVSAAVTTAGVSLGGIPDTTSAAVMPPGESLEGVPDKVSAAVMPAGVSLTGMPDTKSAAVMPPGESLVGVPDKVSAAVMPAGVSLTGIPDTTSAAVLPETPVQSTEIIEEIPETVNAALSALGFPEDAQAQTGPKPCTAACALRETRIQAHKCSAYFYCGCSCSSTAFGIDVTTSTVSRGNICAAFQKSCTGECAVHGDEQIKTQPIDIDTKQDATSNTHDEKSTQEKICGYVANKELVQYDTKIYTCLNNLQMKFDYKQFVPWNINDKDVVQKLKEKAAFAGRSGFFVVFPNHENRITNAIIPKGYFPGETSQEDAMTKKNVKSRTFHISDITRLPSLNCRFNSSEADLSHKKPSLILTYKVAYADSEISSDGLLEKSTVKICPSTRISRVLSGDSSSLNPVKVCAYTSSCSIPNIISSDFLQQKISAAVYMADSDDEPYCYSLEQIPGIISSPSDSDIDEKSEKDTLKDVPQLKGESDRIDDEERHLHQTDSNTSNKETTDEEESIFISAVNAANVNDFTSERSVFDEGKGTTKIYERNEVRYADKITGTSEYASTEDGREENIVSTSESESVYTEKETQIKLDEETGSSASEKNTGDEMIPIKMKNVEKTVCVNKEESKSSDAFTYTCKKIFRKRQQETQYSDAEETENEGIQTDLSDRSSEKRSVASSEIGTYTCKKMLNKTRRLLISDTESARTEKDEVFEDAVDHPIETSDVPTSTDENNIKDIETSNTVMLTTTNESFEAIQDAKKKRCKKSALLRNIENIRNISASRNRTSFTNEGRCQQDKILTTKSFKPNTYASYYCLSPTRRSNLLAYKQKQIAKKRDEKHQPQQMEGNQVSTVPTPSSNPYRNPKRRVWSTERKDVKKIPSLFEYINCNERNYSSETIKKGGGIKMEENKDASGVKKDEPKKSANKREEDRKGSGRGNDRRNAAGKKFGIDDKERRNSSCKEGNRRDLEARLFCDVPSDSKEDLPALLIRKDTEIIALRNALTREGRQSRKNSTETSRRHVNRGI